MKISAFVLPVIVALSGCQAAPTAAPRPSAVTTVSFEFHKNEIILQAASAGGTPLSFMLDTGVDPSVIDTAVAESLGVSVDASIVGEAAGTGDGQGLDVMPATLPSLRIGGTDFPPIDALAADLSGFSAALDLDLAGILGHSFLQGRVLRIDYAAQRIDIAGSRVDLPAPVTRVSRAYIAPFDFVSEEDPTPVFEVIVEGRPVRVSLDTGSSGGLELFADVTKRLGLATVAEAGADAQALGARGQRSLKRSTLENVQVGPFILPELDVRFSDHEAVATEREGNSGNRLFSHFVLTLDYVTHQIVFEQ